MLDKSLQTSVRAQIPCKSVQGAHTAEAKETLIFYTSILSRIWAFFSPEVDQKL